LLSSSSSSSNDVAICRYRDDGQQQQQREYLGRMIMAGRLFGHCGYLVSSSNDDNGSKEEVFVGGNFHVLSAIPRVREIAGAERGINGGGDAHHHHREEERNNLVAEIRRRVDLYLSEEDRQLIASISGHSVEELVNDLNNTNVVSYDVLSRVLSTDRFIPHGVLNTKGLSLLRAVLAERMTLARRRHLGLHHHVDAVEWERDGVLLKDFDYYVDEQNRREFDELLQMVAASKSVVAPSKSMWVERNVTSVARDPQLEPHIDTFHSVVKMWVYERGVVTADTGPLHYMRGSHRNTEGKLRWMYKVSLPPATDAIKEPSLRFRADSDGSSTVTTMADVLRPVLPLDRHNRTLIIADTSGIHHRGSAVPGTVRRTVRVSNGNDGGLPRQNPYFWSGWDDEGPTAAAHGEEGECLERSSI
jgi:hypothetical protein